jgi:hypothetical protein
VAAAEPAVVGRHRHVEALGDPLVASPALEVIGIEDPGGGDEDRPAGAFSRLAQLLLEQRQLACAADQDWTEDALAHPF